MCGILLNHAWIGRMGMIPLYLRTTSRAPADYPLALKYPEMITVWHVLRALPFSSTYYVWIIVTSAKFN